MSDKENYEDGDIPWVTSQDVKSLYLSSTTTMITSRGASELALFPEGALAMVTRSGILRHTLPVAELRKPATVNQDIRVIIPSDSLSGGWLLQFFVARNIDILRRYGKTGTTVESVDFQGMKKMSIPLPPLPEQRLIGDFFRDLDGLIALHQREECIASILFLMKRAAIPVTI